MGGLKTRGKGGQLVLFDWISGTARVKGLNLWRLVRRPAARFVYVKRSIEICGDKRLVIANCTEADFNFTARGLIAFSRARSFTANPTQINNTAE